MKKMKKLVSLLLTMAMILAMTVAASAAGTTNSIEITSKTDGHTYSAYQIFDGDLVEGVLSNIVWGNGIKDESALLQALINSDSIYTTDNCKSASDVAKILSTAPNNTAEKAAAFAKVVANFLTDNSDNVYTTSNGVKNGEKYVYTIDGLDAGYYFVKDSINSGSETENAVSKYIIQVVGTAKVNAKTDVPSVTKKVKEDNDVSHKDTWNDAADYDIGDEVPFRLVGYVPDMQYYDTYFYQFNDTLSNALTLNQNSIKVYLATGDSMSAVNKSVAEGAGGKQIVNTEGKTPIYTVEADSTGFKVKFENLKSVANIQAGNYIVVEYTAKLNNNAVIGNPGNPNEVTLTYSNNPNGAGEGTTKKDEVVVFTFEIPVNKVIASTETSLAGAKFALFANKADADAAATDPSATNLAKALSFTAVNGAAGSYKYDATSATGSVKELETDTTGKYRIQGLDQGTYYLVETVAPDKYNRLLTAQEVKIVPSYEETTYDAHTPDTTNDQLSDVNVTLNAGEPADEVKIENSQGATLPETGGIGTTIFYVLGAILAIGAGLLLITKKRMSAER